MTETLSPTKRAKPQKAPISKYSRADRGRVIDEDGETLHLLLRKLEPEGDTPACATDWLAALVGRNPKFTAQLACDAARAPYEYTYRLDYKFKSSVVIRSERGDKLLITKGYLTGLSERPSDPFAHRVQDSHNFASIALGIPKYPLIEMLTWNDILVHPWTPAAMKTNKKPFDIELTSGKMKPDGRPFVIRFRPGIERKRMRACFKETDRGTENFHGKGRITIRKKLIAWKEFFDRELYKKLYGFPEAVLLFITIDPKKEALILDEIRQVIGSCPYILTQTVPDFEQSGFSVKPHTELIDKPYHRYGYPDFYLSTLSEKAPEDVS